MSWTRTWAVASLWMKLLLRSWRFWILSVLALLIGSIVPLYYSALRWFASGLSGSTALIHHALVPYMGHLSITVILGLAAVWLAFDAPYRHRKSRTEEVLHAAPLSSWELVLGQFLGVFLPIFIVAFVATGIALGIQAAFRVGVPVTPHLVHLFLQSGPGLAFIVAFTLAAAVLTRSRVIAGILGSALVVSTIGVLFGWFEMPWEYQQVLDVSGLWSMYFYSDLVGYVTLGSFIWQRVYLLLVCLAMLALAVWLYPRLRPSKGPGTAPIVAAASLIIALGMGFLWVREGFAERDGAQIAAEEQQALAEGPPTRVSHYDLDVDISRGGNRLAGTARMTLRNDTPAPRSSWTFTLNSGLEVDSVEGAEYERGLTTLVLETPPVPADGEREVTVTYGGELSDVGLFPGGRFELRDLETQNRGNLSLILGASPFLVDDYAYLPPMAKWYPVPDVDHGWTYPEKRPVNWATFDLHLAMPDGWVAASQGAPTDPSTWSSETPVPVISVYAGPYNVYEEEVDGIPVRLLVHPGHAWVIDFFSEAHDEILERGTKILEEAQAKTGLDYPYPILQLVELPLPARAYTDGLDSFAAFHQPGVIALREAGLFTANLEGRLKRMLKQGDGPVRVRVNVNGQDVTDGPEGGEEVPETTQPAGEEAPENEADEPADQLAEQGEQPAEPETDGESEEERSVVEKDVAAVKANLLQSFFRYDFIGGSVPHALVPSLWDYVVQPEGRLWPLLNRGLGGFVSELATGSRRNFSIFAFADLQEAIPEFMQSMFGGGMDADQAALAATVDEDNAFELMTTVPLGEMDPGEDPRGYLDVITLRGHAFFESLEQEVGTSSFAEALALLRERHAYGTYSMQDLQEVMEEVEGEDLDWLFSSWLEGTDLPGFRLTDLRAYRIESRDPQPRYQVMARVQNSETVGGYVTLEVRTENAEEPVANTVHVPGQEAVEWGIVLEDQPVWVRMSPVLALNRGPLRKRLRQEWNPVKPPDGEPFEGTRQAELEPWPAGIMVDDADPGFHVEGADEGFALRFRRNREEEGKLPRYNPWQGVPNRWAQWTTTEAFGRYNPGATVGPAGEGEAAAVWKAELPDAGEYEVLVYHLGPAFERSIPQRRRDTVKLPGEYVYEIATADGPQKIEFDPSRAENGWNSLGEFYFDAGEATLRLSDAIGEGIVYADAVRFAPVEERQAKR